MQQSINISSYCDEAVILYQYTFRSYRYINNIVISTSKLYTYVYVQCFMTDAVVVAIIIMVASYTALQLFSAYNFE